VRILADAPPASIYADEMRLRQAIDNLVDNAIRHTPAGGTVQIRGEAGGGVVRVIVEDDGPGFPSGFEEEALEPFSRARISGAPRHATGGKDAQHEGAGLGLAIARVIAAGHGGNVTAENRAGRGARVTLSITGRHDRSDS
jgi:signal transduction histidine kinase